MKLHKLDETTLNLPERLVGRCGSDGGNPQPGFSRLRPNAFLSSLLVLIAAVGAIGLEEVAADECLAREGMRSIIDRESRSRYEAKLCVTPDEVARYVFLTNAHYDGDHSAAVYRAPGKKGSLSGDYWITATVASDSTRGLRRNVGVGRYDVPLPKSVANVLHQLWVTTLEQTPTDEAAIPEAPTGIFSAMKSSGIRLRAVTVSLQEQHSICVAMMNVGESLVNYAKLPRSKRPRAAAEIEKEARRLLQRRK